MYDLPASLEQAGERPVTESTNVTETTHPLTLAWWFWEAVLREALSLGKDEPSMSV